MNYLVLSPHFDDGVLSCGGLLAAWRRQGEQVAVWTLMAGFPPDDRFSPLAQRVHADWPQASPRAMVALRKEEDRQALTLLGASYRYFDWPDCIYRQASSGEWLYDEIFTRPAPAEDRLADELAFVLSELPDDVQVIAPLAIGGHVDHILVQLGAERSGRPLWYYADVPYVLRAGVDAAFAALAGFEPVTFPLIPADVDAWIAAAACYRSQIPALFGSEAAMRAALRDWAGAPPNARLYFTRSF